MLSYCARSFYALFFSCFFKSLLGCGKLKIFFRFLNNLFRYQWEFVAFREISNFTFVETENLCVGNICLGVGWGSGQSMNYCYFREPKCRIFPCLDAVKFYGLHYFSMMELFVLVLPNYQLVSSGAISHMKVSPYSYLWWYRYF